MSFRNRCQIAGAEGVIDLSIPLVNGRDQKSFIRDVRIADDLPWQAQHWKTIVSCYNRSPWFEFYRDELEALYRKPVGYLLDWDLQCLDWSFRVLGLAPEIGLTESYRKEYLANGEGEGGEVREGHGTGGWIPGREEEEGGGWMAGGGEGWVDMRGALLPRTRAEWGAATPRYRQVFEERTGFLPGLSILDLLFCEGKGAIRYIRP